MNCHTAMSRKNLLELWRVGEIPHHDAHVSTTAEQTRSTQTHRLDAVRVTRLQTVARVNNASTVSRYLEQLHETTAI